MNQPSVESWWREPLLHFLLLGSLLFVVNAFWDQWFPAQENIVVNEGRVRMLAENFRRTWQRPPTASELDGLIEEQIRDEVLTREAQRLGLDRDDTVIRRRLRQKIEIITEEAAASVQPTDAQLQNYLNLHPENFRGESRTAFTQIFLDPSKRGDRLDADAKVLLDRLRADERRPTSTNWQKLGDQLFMLKQEYPLSGEREIATIFGADFASSLLDLKTGEWSGPVRSGYGLHLVRVSASEAAGPVALADIRPVVEREWRNAQRKAGAEAQYQQLRAGYKIVVKRPATATP
ncbi:MAG: peptidyl-prolyl cis-trans isomerase [Rhodocyclaceae bacterium]|nr:peptidyl-prolyl cis-trans isomerase [Rhodocyclaceae bacterium]